MLSYYYWKLWFKKSDFFWYDETQSTWPNYSLMYLPSANFLSQRNNVEYFKSYCVINMKHCLICKYFERKSCYKKNPWHQKKYTSCISLSPFSGWKVTKKLNGKNEYFQRHKVIENIVNLSTWKYQIPHILLMFHPTTWIMPVKWYLLDFK